MDPTLQTRVPPPDQGVSANATQAPAIPNDATARLDSSKEARSDIMSSVSIIQIQTLQGALNAVQANSDPSQCESGLTDRPSTPLSVGGLSTARPLLTTHHHGHPPHKGSNTHEPRLEKQSERPESKQEQGKPQVVVDNTEQPRNPRAENIDKLQPLQDPARLKDSAALLKESPTLALRESLTKQEPQLDRASPQSLSEKGPLPAPEVKLEFHTRPLPLESLTSTPPEIARPVVEPSTQPSPITQDRPKLFESPLETVLRAFVQNDQPAREPQREQSPSISGALNQIALNHSINNSTLAQASNLTSLQPLTELRSSVLDKLSQISEHVKLSTEVRPKPHTEPDAAIQGRGAFQHIERIDRSARPEHALQWADRTIATTPQNTKGMFEPSPAPLVDLLARLTKNQNLLSNLKRIEATVDGIFATIATGAVLGAIGTQKLGALITAAILELIKAFERDLHRDENSKEAKTSLHLLITELGDGVRAQIVEDPFALVGDITGRIVEASTGLPIEGLVVYGGSLGTCVTTKSGEFIFKNVPLGSGFILKPLSSNYRFNPEEIAGTATQSSHCQFTADHQR